MKLLAVIDMQNDFIDGALGTKEAEAIVPAVKARIEECRRDGWDVVFTRDTHTKDYLNTQEGRNLPVVHCVKDTDGWAIRDGLAVDSDRVFDKPAFGSVELMRAARDWQPDEIELVGLCTDICVISNAMLLKAALPETPVAVRAACCAGVTPESHDNALAAMRMCQIEIV